MQNDGLRTCRDNLPKVHLVENCPNMQNQRTRLFASAVLLLAFALHGAQPSAPFVIEVKDQDTGRGVPLVELETVNHLRFLTDNAGRVALFEPSLMDQTVFFHVRSHGYATAKDGFGFQGNRLVPRPGETGTISLKRLNIAERLYRVTGEGLYRDTVLAGLKAPIDHPLLNAQVSGQDSVQVALYRDRYYWFWGDTDRVGYPLGNFRTTGATSALVGQGGLNPAVGVNLNYFTNHDGFVKKMCPFGPSEGVVWIDGLLTLRAPSGNERLVAHYARMKSLGEQLGHGLAIFKDDKDEFELLLPLEMTNRWRHPHNQALLWKHEGTSYFLFGDSIPNVRVKADWQSVGDPAAYEAWTCLDPAAPTQNGLAILRDEQGAPRWRWTREAPPVRPADEAALVRQGQLRADETRMLPLDVESDKPVRMHRGSVRWNAFRQRWILIATQEGGTSSHLGEVWYAEASHPTGPWRRAIRIVTHDHYSFYNPVQHDFFDQEGGRLIYFEGTYASTFSAAKFPTPRYDYNQILYRLDLNDPRLAAVRVRE